MNCPKRKPAHLKTHQKSSFSQSLSASQQLDSTFVLSQNLAHLPDPRKRIYVRGQETDTALHIHLILQGNFLSILQLTLNNAV